MSRAAPLARQPAAPAAAAATRGFLQRKCACGAERDEEALLRSAAPGAATPQAAPGAWPAIVGEVLASPGQPLDAPTSAALSARFAHDFGRVRVDAGRSSAALEQEAEQAAARIGGQPLQLAAPGTSAPPHAHDFSRVRIHTDARAAASARAVHALAYTVGEHIVFGAGQFGTDSDAGRRLLAHELTHTVQQGGGLHRLARACDPAWAGLPWDQRVANAKGASGDNQCVADMMGEALRGSATVEQKTNTAPNVNAAIAAGRYVEWGTLSDTHVNYDRNLNQKIGNNALFGFATFRTNAAQPDAIRIFILFGPQALNAHGPDFTQMVFEHESAHAWDFLRDWAMQGSSPHSATPGEELAIYAEGFSRHFLDMWTLNNAPPGSFQMAEAFSPLFHEFGLAATTEQDAAFESMRLFHQVRIVGIACNEMKFKIWLQMMQNQRAAGDPLVARLNALPGLGLTRGTNAANHLNTGLSCS
ncbi:DUF4157 domain-containing protein [Pseudorhodoferax sp. Leaf267]|uniref:eCIS core domain-containing protein n=1 Tax=Pseudorhodoferax sp. Leaf267 TaxID=1736316 RepID=UPI0006F9D4C6|nr:DUF4157 domain-containing protein [Pseudorhodoferax sp. Leaf267]KQP12276.1 hypothetical protein ASF43_22490 [Pseudorhodoferax sp. Leaf267]